MTHLEEVRMSYMQHWARAWAIATVIIVHGVFPNIWKHKASDMLCKND